MLVQIEPQLVAITVILKIVEWHRVLAANQLILADFVI